MSSKKFDSNFDSSIELLYVTMLSFGDLKYTFEIQMPVLLYGLYFLQFWVLNYYLLHHLVTTQSFYFILVKQEIAGAQNWKQNNT